MDKIEKKFSYFLALFLLLISFSSIAEQDEEFLPVEQAFSYQSRFTEGSLLVNWQISEGYYLYQKRISATQNNQPLTITFPEKAIDKEDEFFGKVKVFKHNLAISIALQDSSPVTLSFQGCAEQGLCYPPVLIRLTPAQQTAQVASPSTYSESEQGYISNLFNRS